MGIALAIVYLPSLGLIALFAIYLSSKLKIKSRVINLNPAKRIASITIGVITCSAVTWFAIQSDNLLKASGFELLVDQIIISLLLPFTLGLLLVGITYSKRNSNSTLAIHLNRMGVGALHSVWIFPFAMFAYVTSADLRYQFTDEHKRRIARFEELCNKNRINIVSTVSGVKSVYTSLYSGLAYSLVEKLEFSESKHMQFRENDPRYVRYTKADEKITSSSRKYDVNRIEVKELDSEYEITYEVVTEQSDKENNLYVEQNTVLNRHNGKVLATFSHVSITGGKSRQFGSFYCPNREIGSRHQVSSYVLGLMEPAEAMQYKKKLAAYHQSIPKQE